MDIRNMPAEASNYEFVVAIPNADYYTFVGMFVDGHKAAKAALEYGGIVIPNALIKGHQPPELKEKRYVFSGVWFWECWATSEEEARKQFNNDWTDVELGLDHYEIEVDE